MPTTQTTMTETEIETKTRSAASPATTPADDEQRMTAHLELDREITQLEQDLTLLRQAREILRARRTASPATPPTPAPAIVTTANRSPTPSLSPPTIADAVEHILTEHGEMHCDLICRELERRYTIAVTKKNLVNTLNRWISRKARFERPRSNTFALRSGNGGAK